MSDTHAIPQRGKSPRHSSAAMQGFSLLELLIAMAIFLVVSGAAFSLFNQSVSLATRQQNLSGVNIGLRNAMSQLEMDLSGAGQNMLAGLPSGNQFFSLGVILQNNVPGVAAACTPAAGWAYPVPSACFDTLTINNLKPCTAAGGANAPVLVIDNPGKSGDTEDLSVSSITWGNDPNSGANLSNDASCFSDGDELLVIQFPTNGTNQLQCASGCMAVVTLTKDAQVSGGKIQLQHHPSGAGSDPLGILSNAAGGTNFGKENALGFGFSNGAYIIDLGNGASSITYAVLPNPADPSDTQLVRCAAATCTAANGQPVTDQVIGFKIGAALYNKYTAGGGADIANYIYDSTKYCQDPLDVSNCNAASPPAADLDPNDFTLIRAVRISLIGRTPPRHDITLSNFKNSFDGGPYLVQQASVVVDLRNLSKPEFGN